MLDDFVHSLLHRRLLSRDPSYTLVIKAWKHTKCSNNSVVIDVC